MLKSKSIALLVAIGLILVMPSPLVAQRLSASLPDTNMLDRYGLKLAWWGQAVLNPSRDRVRYVTLDEEHLFVQATSGVVTAFDNETGRKLWAQQLGPHDSPSFPATSNKNDLLVVSGMMLYSMDKFRGDVNWQVRLPKLPSTSPAADAEHVYVGALDGSVFSLSLRKLKELYEENMLPQYANEALAWRYKTAKQVTTPAITDGLVVNFASRDGSLYAISAGKPRLRWQFETDEPISAPLARSNESLILTSEDFMVYSINNTGRVNWSFVSGYPVRKPPRVIGEQLFLFPEGGGMFCLSVQTGLEQWWVPRITNYIAATRTRLFVSDQTGNVVMFFRKDGALIGSLPLRHFTARPGNDRTDRMYLATQSGRIVCIRETEQEFPTYHMYPEQLPILPGFATENPDSEQDADDNSENGDSTENGA